MSTEPEESRTASDSFSDFEDLETFLFERVGPHFRKTGQLRSMDFIAILVWKANRAKTRHIRRLVSKGFTLSQVVQAIADQLTSAPDQKSCLSMLMKQWGFRLPTATAILAVLFPDRFLIYDVRVYGQIKDEFLRRGKVTIASGFAVGKLADKSFSDKLWMEYQRYIEMARCIAPARYRTLRDVDKYLWGRDWYEGNQRSARLVSLSEMQDRLRGAETSGFSVVQGSEPVGGVQLIPWHKYGAVAEQLLRIFDEDWAPLISRRFDLDLWMYTPEGAYLMGGVWGSAGPNEQQIATAICCILRQQKFNDGALQGYFQSGLLYKLARRAGEIYDELQNPSGVGPQHAPVLD